MRVVIEVVAGPLLGRRFNLVRNQRLEVGSTPRADICVRGDAALAPHHFALETDQQLCRVRDLSGQAATLVNGQPVESAVVKTGDEIRAGGSRFKVLVEGDAPGAVPEIVAAKPAKPKGRAVRPAEDAAFSAVLCDTGLNRYTGNCRQFPPGDLAASLAAEWPLVLMADNRRLNDEALVKLEGPQYLFDWLGEAATTLSPVILPPGSVPEPAALVGRGFGKDGVIAFFSKNGPDKVVACLRASARMGQDRVVGICWPKILSYLLSHYQPDFVKQLTEPFACILLEDPVAADRWQLYSAEALDERLKAMGLKPAAERA